MKEGTITVGTRILAHYVAPFVTDYNHMKRGKVHICKNVFIGMNVVIAKPVTIGEGAVIGANSVILQDIKSNTV